MISAISKRQAGFEKSLLLKIAAYKYHQSTWKKLY
jgi:hypothetical protein